MKQQSNDWKSPSFLTPTQEKTESSGKMIIFLTTCTSCVPTCSTTVFHCYWTILWRHFAHIAITFHTEMTRGTANGQSLSSQ